MFHHQLEGIPSTTSGLEDQQHVASSPPPIPSGDVCRGGLDESYGCQHEERGAAADETSLEEKVIDADTMPASFSPVVDADAGASTPRSE